MKALWRHVAYNYREGGVSQVIYKVGWRARQWLWSGNSWLVYQWDLKMFRKNPALPLTSSSLDLESLQRLGYFKASAFPEGLQDRLDSGAVCWGFFLDGELVNIGWALRDCLEIEPGMCIFRERCVSIYDCFTLPEHRSKGIYTDALIRMLGNIQDEGAESALIAVDPDNVPSIKAIEKAGFQPLYQLTRKRRFGRQFLVNSPFVARSVAELRA